MDELITKHSAIMDKAGRDEALAVPGRQQEGRAGGRRVGRLVRRGARHRARLQAMLLTNKEKMLRTPTYGVFEMFKVGQGGTFLPVELQSPDYAFGQKRIPMVSVSATRAADGSTIHLSLVNTSPAQAMTLSVRLAGLRPKSVAGRS